jgi:hypothetical protein
VRSAVLVDDIHVGGSMTSADAVRRWATELGFGVDSVVEESALVVVAKRVIKSLPRCSLYWEPFRRATKRVLFLYSNDGGIALGAIDDHRFKPTCALLIASWNLSRLGAFSVGDVPTATVATSVLEERYRAVEMKALRIIEASPYRALSSRVSHIFY